jgi:putative ABC transport system substrate-binding protein
VEGRNFILERRSAEGKFERFGEIVAELLRLKAEAIVTLSIPLTLEAKKRTNSVPIVFLIAGGGDPVAAGIVPSLARPGGNITGVLDDAGPEIFGKRLQYLKEAVPGISRIAYLGLASEWDSPYGRSARDAAHGLATAMFLAEVTPGNYARAFEAIKRERADAIFTAGHPVHYANRKLTADFALRNRLPSTHGYSAAAEEGGLMSYSSISLWPEVAEYVDRIVRGTKPGDLPVLQPTRFELVVNLKTARALGITIPQSVLLRAERVIE